MARLQRSVGGRCRCHGQPICYEVDPDEGFTDCSVVVVELSWFNCSWVSYEMEGRLSAWLRRALWRWLMVSLIVGRPHQWSPKSHHSGWIIGRRQTNRDTQTDIYYDGDLLLLRRQRALWSSANWMNRIQIYYVKISREACHIQLHDSPRSLRADIHVGYTL